MSSVKEIARKKNLDWVTDLKFNDLPRIKDVAFIKDEIAFVLEDDRVIYIPVKWSKKLNHAMSSERANYKTNGYHVFWDDIDEIIGVKNILFGKKLNL